MRSPIVQRVWLPLAFILVVIPGCGGGSSSNGGEEPTESNSSGVSNWNEMTWNQDDWQSNLKQEK